MREIRFRAWNISTKRLLNWAEIAFNVNPFFYDDPEFILEQYTGLKDKNGKKIYEGDRCNILISSGEYAIAHVVYCDGCFELWFIHPIVIAERYETRDYLKCFVVNHAVEVIGNIHENMETKMTEDGDYPSGEIIYKIIEWPDNDVMGLIAFIQSIWHWPDMAKLDGNKFELHTGGWSGNEDIVDALMGTIFWMLCWESSRRGGHFYFEIPKFITEKAKDGN